MNLKSEYELEDEIPTDIEVKDLFEEREGRWVLKKDSIEGVKTDADVSRLSAALGKEREARRKAETSLKALPGSPEEILEELDLLRNAESGEKTKTQVQNREIVKLQQELDKYKDRAGALEAQYNQSLLKETVSKAAVEMGVTTEALEDVQLWGSKLFTVRDGEVVAQDESSVMSPEDWISGLKSNGKKQYWFNQSSGAGATGSKSTGTSPEVAYFKKDTFNLSKIMEIQARDASKADKFAKMAGFESVDEAIAQSV